MPTPSPLQALPPVDTPPTQGEGRGPAVQQMFNRIAATYDLLNDCISLGMHRGWKQAAVKRLNLSLGQHVLDVCTGTGDLVNLLQPLVGATGEITGLDFSEDMLAVARKRFAPPLGSNVRFVQGNAMALPFEANTFDGAIVAFGLRNVERVPQALVEMARVVKPGGWIVNLDTVPNPPLPGFNLYFSTIMPLVGRLISNDPGAYRYLFQSTQAFHPPDVLCRLMEEAGLTQVSATALGFGSVSCQAGQKPHA